MLCDSTSFPSAGMPTARTTSRTDEKQASKQATNGKGTRSRGLGRWDPLGERTLRWLTSRRWPPRRRCCGSSSSVDDTTLHTKALTEKRRIIVRKLFASQRSKDERRETSAKRGNAFILQLSLHALLAESSRAEPSRDETNGGSVCRSGI